MNINDPTMWYQGEIPLNSPATWRAFLTTREATFKGFAEIEAGNGFITPTVSINTSRGQDVIRLLGFRVLEEAVESMQAEEAAHVKEEAIDSINYLLSLLIIDPKSMNYETVTRRLAEVSSLMFEAAPCGLNGRMNPRDLSVLTQLIAGDLADTLRNRSWMKNAQDPYFSRMDILLLCVARVLEILLRVFTSWEEFVRFYISKDAVLKFRLRTGY